MKCIECQTEGFHKMDCGSKILMMDYEAFVSKLEHLPEILLNDLRTRCNAETSKRMTKEIRNEIPTLFDMYVRKEE